MNYRMSNYEMLIESLDYCSPEDRDFYLQLIQSHSERLKEMSDYEYKEMFDKIYEAHQYR